MANALIQVAFRHDSGLPEDVTVNTFSVNTAAETVADAGTDILGRLTTFYTSNNTNHPLEWYLSNVLTGVADVKMYDRADPEPRVPEFEGVINLGAAFPGSSTPYPSEVAVTLSFEAAQVSGINQARRRGRIFLGPLNPGAAAFTSGKAKVAPILLADAAVAMARLRSDLITDGYRWQVWSRAGNQGADVASGWIDDALDTQRRRGERATTRTLWS